MTQQPAATPDGGELLANLVLFGGLLRRAGLGVTPDQLLTLVAALDEIDIGRRRDVRAAARTILVQRQADLAAFDRLFDLFWRPGGPSAGGAGPRPIAPRRRQARRLFALLAPPGGAAADPAAPSEPLRGYSAGERLRHKDFAELVPAEERSLRRLLAEIRVELPPRASRRRVAARSGSQLDLRRSLRRSLRYGGRSLELAWRERKLKRRPLVLLCDISGSMEIYTRVLLQFLYAVARVGDRVEVFLFGTRLTRVTRQLRRRDVDHALAGAADAARDWGGGTRIGDSLRRFNFIWGRRVLGEGAVVAVISDGWDRGDPELLARELARLRRSSERLLWLNPLLGSPGYRPLTRGMKAALPHLDDFLPVHNLRSLEQLAELLGRLRRPAAAPAWRRVAADA